MAVVLVYAGERLGALIGVWMSWNHSALTRPAWTSQRGRLSKANGIPYRVSEGTQS